MLVYSTGVRNLLSRVSAGRSLHQLLPLFTTHLICSLALPQPTSLPIITFSIQPFLACLDRTLWFTSLIGIEFRTRHCGTVGRVLLRSQTSPSRSFLPSQRLHWAFVRIEHSQSSILKTQDAPSHTFRNKGDSASFDCMMGTNGMWPFSSVQPPTEPIESFNASAMRQLDEFHWYKTRTRHDEPS